MRDRMGLLLPICVMSLLFTTICSPDDAWGKSTDSLQGSIVLILETPEGLEITQDEMRYDKIRLPGFSNVAPPGSPTMPQRVYNVALPPDADWSTLDVQVLTTEVEDVPGTFTVEPGPAAATWDEDIQILDWVAPVDRIVDGKDLSVYSNNAYYPGRFLDVVSLPQMRKWRYVRLLYMPVQYNPVTGRLRVATKVQIKLSFRRDPSLVNQALLNDKLMDDVAKRILLNYDTARVWYISEGYGSAPQQTHDYVIITTNAIESGSARFWDFVTHKQNKGFSVLTITEDEYGSLTGQPPNGAAEKIRQWLINNYVSYGIEYVLLIGNPNPSSGDVPMKMCWPRRHESDDRESPTDYFFADLTGNWDLDGDTYFGEYNGDRGTGGVDFANEVYVGRIPVYGADYETLDAVLQKIIDYETESGDLTWRSSALLPMSFSDSTTDGAHLAEDMIDDYLTSNGYSSYTLYQHKTSGCSSSFSSDEDLVDDAVRSHWVTNDYGLVTWWGHGSSTRAYIGYGGSCSDGYILESSDCPSLDDDHPAFVYQCSCTNGYPESSSNLGYSLLKSGAIGTVSASRVSWYALGSWHPGLKYYADNASIGYFYDEQLVDEQPAARALFLVKSDMGQNLNNYWDGSSWMNLMDFNLYGAPDTAISDGSSLPRPTLYDPGDFSTTGNYTVDWSDVSGTSYYKLQEASNPSFTGYTQYTPTTSQQQFWGKADGHYYYRVGAHIGGVDGPWSSTKDIIVDKTPPSNPSSVWSPSHGLYTWSSDNTVEVSWSGADDGGGSGVDGYSIEWSTWSSTVPDETVDTSGNSATSPPLTEGNNWYFHVRTRDKAGNWNSGAVHLGPFYIDIIAPSNPGAVWSTSHNTYTWSDDDTIDMAWNEGWDGDGSGVEGYSILWDTNTSTIPDATVDTTGTSATSTSLGDGNSWYFHIRTGDNAGNWTSEAVHQGPYQIDTHPPTNPTSIWSPSHEPSVWSDDSTVEITWSGADDWNGIGIAGYSVEWNTFPDTLPDDTIDVTGTHTTSLPLDDGSSWYFHLRTADHMGHWASEGVHLGPFHIDTMPPTGSILINDDEPYTFNRFVNLSLPAEDAGSGVVEMRLRHEGQVGDWEDYASTRVFKLQGGDGLKAIAVCYRDAVDKASTWYTDTVLLDTVAPDSSVSALPPEMPSPSFRVGWLGLDPEPGSGLASYDVQYRVGKYGEWENWFSGVTATSAVFGPGYPVHPQPGQTYYFRCRAQDNAGNLEAYPAGDGDTWTTISGGFQVYLPIVVRH